MNRFGLAGLAVLVAGSVAIADEVILTNGSRLVGQVQAMAAQQVLLKTDYAGVIKVDASHVRGVSTDGPLTIELKSGDRAVGTLSYSEDGGQTVDAKTMGLMGIDLGQVSAMWSAGEDSPEVAALREALRKEQNPWSARLELGLDGQSGNTDRLAVSGAAEVRRRTDRDRLLIYGRGRSSHENGDDTVKEVIGGIHFEVDVDDRWFWFARTEFEFDKFENLDLRTTVSGGVGYVVIQEKDREWRWRAGLGLKHESFDTGNSDTQAIGDLGWDYRQELAPWALFTHHFSYYPTFDDVGDFRISMENAVELPLNPDKTWKFRLGVRNDYDAMPEPGIKRLDNYYFMNIACDWQ